MVVPVLIVVMGAVRAAAVFPVVIAAASIRAVVGAAVFVES